MPSLLFDREVELIVSDLQANGKISIRHRNFAEDATNIDESTELDVDEMESLQEWLRQQISDYRQKQLSAKGKGNPT